MSDTVSYTGTNVSILYCSGQYFKTSSIDLSVWLSSADNGVTGGELLAKDVKPDNRDAAPGFYSYGLNVTILPVDGMYMTGPYVISVYETMTGEWIGECCRRRALSLTIMAGYYNPMNYAITSVNVTLATSGETCDDGDRC